MAAGGPGITGYGELTVLGRGGFATVYRGRQLAFDREVAIKVVDRPSTDERTFALFQRECRAVGGLSWHPHVVPVYDAGETEDGRPYLVMELIPGGTVADVLERGPLTSDEVIRYGVQVADAVAAAHEVGVLHRDLKPANVLIDRRGQARLADFGIARVNGADTTTAGAVSGTLAFIAPELLSGQRATPASDVYGIGITLATMLLGRNPFLSDSDETPFAVMPRVREEPVVDLRTRNVPGPLAALVARCTAKDPVDRPASAAAVAEALRAMAPGDGGGPSRPEGGGGARPWSPETVVTGPPDDPTGHQQSEEGDDRSPTWIKVLGIGLALALLVALVGAAVLVLGDDDGGSAADVPLDRRFLREGDLGVPVSIDNTASSTAARQVADEACAGAEEEMEARTFVLDDAGPGGTGSGSGTGPGPTAAGALAPSDTGTDPRDLRPDSTRLTLVRTSPFDGGAGLPALQVAEPEPLVVDQVLWRFSDDQEAARFFDDYPSACLTGRDVESVDGVGDEAVRFSRDVVGSQGGVIPAIGVVRVGPVVSVVVSQAPDEVDPGARPLIETTADRLEG